MGTPETPIKLEFSRNITGAAGLRWGVSTHNQPLSTPSPSVCVIAIEKKKACKSCGPWVSVS